MVGRIHLHGDFWNLSFHSLLDQILHKGLVVLRRNLARTNPHLVLLVARDLVHEAISMMLERLNPALQPAVDQVGSVGVRSMENKKFLPHTNKQAKIYLLDCSNESME